MTELSSLLHQFAGLFDRLDVPYAVMGGWAVRLYALPRPTYDIDFTILIDRERLPDLYETARDAGFSVPEKFAAGWIDSVAGMPLVKFRLFVEGHSIDIDVFLAESDYQRAIMDRRQSHEVAGRAAWFVSPEDLVLLKLIAGRKRDLADIEDILLGQPDVDEAYMRRWAKPLGVADQLEQALVERA
jgi:hypothetical protein